MANHLLDLLRQFGYEAPDCLYCGAQMSCYEINITTEGPEDAYFSCPQKNFGQIAHQFLSIDPYTCIACKEKIYWKSGPCKKLSQVNYHPDIIFYFMPPSINVTVDYYPSFS